MANQESEVQKPTTFLNKNTTVGISFISLIALGGVIYTYHTGKVDKAVEEARADLKTEQRITLDSVTTVLRFEALEKTVDYNNDRVDKIGGRNATTIEALQENIREIEGRVVELERPHSDVQ